MKISRIKRDFSIVIKKKYDTRMFAELPLYVQIQVIENGISRIKRDFSIVIKNKKILGILLYGSHAQGTATYRSDVDICVVAPDEDVDPLLSFILKNVNANKKKYDTRMFAELPLYVQIQVIENGIFVYSHNKFELYEYFYYYRKLWADQKYRLSI